MYILYIDIIYADTRGGRRRRAVADVFFHGELSRGAFFFFMSSLDVTPLGVRFIRIEQRRER